MLPILNQIIQELGVNLSSCDVQSEAAAEYQSSTVHKRLAHKLLNVRIQVKPKTNTKGR